MITMPVFPRRKLRLGALALPQGSTPGKHKAKSSGVEVGAGLHPHPPPLLAASRGIHLQIAEGINSPACSWASEGDSCHFWSLNCICPSIHSSILQIYVKASLHHRFWAGCGGYNKHKRQICKQGEVTWQYVLRRESNRKWDMAWRLGVGGVPRK